MPVEAKPLFRPDVLRPYLSAFPLPAHVAACRPKLAHWADLIASARALAAEALNLENEVSNLVNEAYGLTPDEIALMWDTAPPRMPIPKPG